jgi:arylsulfatase A-like enzyme
MNHSNSRTQGLWTAVAISFGLLLASGLQKFSDMNSMMFSTPIIDSALAGSIWNTKLGLNLALFALAIVAVHLLFALGGWLLGIASQIAWRGISATRRQWVMLWMFAGVLSVALSSAGIFRSTALARHYGPLAMTPIAGMPLHQVFTVAAVAAAVLTLLVAAVRVSRERRRPAGAPGRVVWLAAVAAPLAIVIATAIPTTARGIGSSVESADQRPPNVIFIGIDSLRTDIMPLNASSPLTPNINRFLGGATRFADAVTPLARTFPSWVALLTGRHPHTTGAFNNLLPRERIDTKGTIADVLRAHGYQTIYAIDEARFSNVDESYGFDQVIGPPMGASEFVISFFADLPLLNVMVNTRLGELIFPHLHANRGTARLYDPNSFARKLDREVVPRQPTFLATHLTLSHWPYYWADSTPPEIEPDVLVPSFYLDAVRRVDRQFGDIWQSLQSKGLLENAIVVVFSDHGESFTSQDDSLVPFDSPEIIRLGAKPGWGHGTSVLAPHQYGVVLSVGRFVNGAPVKAPALISEPVSIEDVTPTVLDLLDIESPAPMDGRSLAPWIVTDPQGAPSIADRVRYTETEFNPRVIAAITGQIHTQAVSEMSQYYSVDPRTDRVEVKDKYIDWMRRTRQFAAIGPTQVLAAVPSMTDGRHLRLLVPRAGGFPRRLDAAPDPATNPEAALLWQQLDVRYGRILDEGLVRMRDGSESSQSDADGHPVTLNRGTPSPRLMVRSQSIQ